MDAHGDTSAASSSSSPVASSSSPWWGHKAAAVAAAASADVMNQQCRVCGEPAAGFHFGAFTCEGCKSFFGRTYNNLSSISECKNNGECVINKKNRTSCKACRLRKCLLVGMSKSGSRYGRRSNWFKYHCLLQEQQHQAQQKQMQHTSSGESGMDPRAPPATVAPPKSNPGAVWIPKKEPNREDKGGNATPPPPAPHTPVPCYTADAAAAAAAAAAADAFWTQFRNSLLHLPGSMSLLAPPFVQGAGFNPYQTPKNFFMPISSSSALHFALRHPLPVIRSPPTRCPQVPTPRSPTISPPGTEDRPVTYLGPEQDQPLDLSLKCSSSERPSPGSTPETLDSSASDDDEPLPVNDQEEASKIARTPLDLTTRF